MALLDECGLSHCITNENRDQMDQDLSMSEIKVAINSLNLKSAGGPSSVNAALMKCMVQIIPEFILKTLNDFFF